ncbi:MAG: ROK family protein [Deltaproteobacteria bacterium]|nr:ROK family protein [Deltaproteobacteria bacterium]
MFRIGVDLGGTKIEGVLLGADGAELARERLPTPNGDYRGTLDAIRTIVSHLETRGGQQATVGVGTPGAVSRALGGLKNSNSVVLNGKPLVADLEALLARAVRIENDANCFALSEATDGAAAGAAVVFGVILGTGVGAGIVVHGQVLAGKNGIAGEWGHNPLPWPADGERPGPSCYCGKHGCIETYLSGPGFARDHAEATGEALEPKAIVAAACAGNRGAAASLSRYRERLARGLAHVINILDPDVVVLGGGMSNVEALYAGLPAALGRWVFSDRVDTVVVQNRFGDSSGVRGAAWLWPGA